MKQAAQLAGVLVICACLAGCAAKRPVKRQPVVAVPPNCIVVVEFPVPCPKAKGKRGFVCPETRIVIKPLPECNAFNLEEVLQVPK